MFINFDGKIQLSYRRRPYTLACAPEDFFSVIDRHPHRQLCCFVREQTIAAILLKHCPRSIFDAIVRRYFQVNRIGRTLLFEDGSRLETKSVARFLVDTFGADQNTLADIAEGTYCGKKTIEGNYVKFFFKDRSALAIDRRRLSPN